MLTFAFALLFTLAPPQEGGLPKMDCVKFEIEGDIWRGIDNCVLEYQGMRFEAPWIAYNNATGDVTAGDHIHFTRGKEDIDGSRLEINVNTKAGTVWDAKGVVEPGFHVTARIAHRFEDSSWEFHNSVITACNDPEPCWTISLRRSLHRPGEWVKGRDSIFRFHGVPIFWLPYIMTPSEQKQRSTGFLIPSVSKSNVKGWGFHDEFYYVINRSADASVIGEYYSIAGPTAELTFRARPTQSGYIGINAFFARDIENPLAQKRNDIGRSLRVTAYSYFGTHTRAVADLETESSVSFRQFWADSFNAIASPINRSVGFLTTTRPNYSLNVMYSRSEFLNTFPATSLRKLPSFDVQLPSRRIFSSVPVFFRFEGSVSNVSRTDRQTINQHWMGRFDLHPTLQMPLLRSDAIELSQEMGIRETGYTHSLQPDFENVSLNRFSLEYAAHFAGPELDKAYGKWRHSIRPTVDYRYVTGADQFRRTVVVDEVDLDVNTSELEYGITNRIIGDREVLSWRVAQVAYFRPTFGGAIVPNTRNVFNPLLGLTGYSFADGPRGYSPVVSTLRFTPGSIFGVDFQSDYDTQLGRMRSTGMLVDFRKGMWGANGSYVFKAETSLQKSDNQLHGAVTYGNGLNRGLSFYASLAYSVEQRLFQGLVTRIGYNAECYGLTAEYTDYNLGFRQEHKLRFALQLKNIGTFGNMRSQDRIF